MFAEQAPGNLQLKWAAFVAIFFALIAMGITSAVTDYLTNVKLGAWWAALAIILVSIIAAVSKSRYLYYLIII